MEQTPAGETPEPQPQPGALHVHFDLDRHIPRATCTVCGDYHASLQPFNLDAWALLHSKQHQAARLKVVRHPGSPWWAVCGPWRTQGEVPDRWGGSVRSGDCQHHGHQHRHITFATWGKALWVADRLARQATQPAP